MNNRATTRTNKEVELKRLVFLIIACLLVLGIVLPGCGGEGEGEGEHPLIVIGVPYPQGDIQGNAMLSGAQMAEAEINAAGGVSVYNATSNTTTVYDIDVVGRQDNEIYNPPDAWNAVNYLITNSHAQFIIGGFRTEAVVPMITNVFATASPSVPFFICGAATAELLSGLGLLSNPPPASANYPTGSGTPYWDFNATTSDFYKYIFRTTPFNTGFLLGMVMSVFSQVAQDVQTAMGWGWNGSAFPHKVNVAIVGENLTWAAPILGGYKALVAGYSTYYGWSFCATTSYRTFSDTASSGTIDAALTDIQNAQCQIILTCMSGPCGQTFGKEMKALNITAIPVGINVEAQNLNYGITTGSNYEVTTGTYAAGVSQTNLTAGFISRYQAFAGSMPIYTAASYSQIVALKDAIEATDSLDKDVVCEYLESHGRLDPTGFINYYPEWDKVTHYATLKRGAYPVDLPALNATQVDALYAANGYSTPVTGFNFTMDPFTSHDLVYGPGYLTGICIQWVGGAQVGVWPNSGYDIVLAPPYAAAGPVQTTLMRKLCGLNWSNSLEYSGTSAVVIPAPYQAQWAIWFP
jgi:branched-chain amino acid transport system substrate-binding protein